MWHTEDHAEGLSSGITALIAIGSILGCIGISCGIVCIVKRKEIKKRWHDFRYKPQVDVDMGLGGNWDGRASERPTTSSMGDPLTTISTVDTPISIPIAEHAIELAECGSDEEDNMRVFLASPKKLGIEIANAKSVENIFCFGHLA